MFENNSDYFSFSYDSTNYENTPSLLETISQDLAYLEDDGLFTCFGDNWLALSEGNPSTEVSSEAIPPSEVSSEASTPIESEASTPIESQVSTPGAIESEASADNFSERELESESSLDSAEILMEGAVKVVDDNRILLQGRKHWVNFPLVTDCGKFRLLKVTLADPKKMNKRWAIKLFHNNTDFTDILLRSDQDEDGFKFAFCKKREIKLLHSKVPIRLNLHFVLTCENETIISPT
jgi:hypothetical protein